MDKVILENFRCFRSYQEIPLKPLTFLVGENSTGKTSLLAAIRLAWDVALGNEEPDFNAEPFKLGSFNNIVSNRNSKVFKIGCSLKGVHRTLPRKDLTTEKDYTFLGEFGKSYTEPNLLCKKVQFDSYSISLTRMAEKEGFSPLIVTVEDDSRQIQIEVELRRGPEVPTWDTAGFVLWSLSKEARESRLKKQKTKKKAPLKKNKTLSDKEIDIIHNHLRAISSRHFSKRGMNYKPIAIAPIRAKPQRTYDEFSEIHSSSGNHALATFARISDTNDELLDTLKSEILLFAKNSGLFNDIRIVRSKTELTDTFFVHVKVGSKFCNLIDVGYGVSQVLPFLIDCQLNQEKERAYLLQQPEVHLHPRAQAELGTFFSRMVQRTKMNYVIETHSDYLLDRVRLDIRNGVKGHIDHNDLLILYFYRKGNEVIIDPISVDESGNLLNPPKGYRKFFLEEQDKFFGE